MNTISINGMNVSGSFSGKGVVIANGKVFVDGQDVTPDSKNITIEVNGNVDKLQVDACSKITVKGSVGDIKTQSGDVNVEEDVRGSISTMSGDVDCNQVHGSVSTMSGNIKNRK
jgi:DUF4097 and DUF4098 domain-containing protein YvlB